MFSDITVDELSDLFVDRFDWEQESPLYGKRILFVMGGSDGNRALYECGYELGLRMAIMDSAGHWAEDYVDQGLFEAFIELPMNAKADSLEEAIAALLDIGLCFDGVATFEDDAILLTARLAVAMGLPGHSIQAAAAIQNKWATREICAAAGFPLPRFAHDISAYSLERTAESDALPNNLNPTQDATCTDIDLFPSAQMLQSRLRRIVAEQCGSPQKNYLSSKASYPGDSVQSDSFARPLEAYLDGDTFQVDCLLSQGELVFTSIVGEDPQHDMFCAGTPLPLSCLQDQQIELSQMAEEVLHVFGFTSGVFHLEAQYTSNGIQLLKVNARLGSSAIYQMIKHVRGMDMVEQYLLTCIGLTLHLGKAIGLDHPLQA